VETVFHQIHALQRDRPAGLDHEPGITSTARNPSGELLRIGDRCRQAHQRDLNREMNDHLLPDRTAIPILQVMDLVQHHHRKSIERRRLGIDHVAKHLGRHHDNRSITVDDIVPGQ